MGKIIDIDDGILVVSSDLQGNLGDYRKIRERFQQLRAAGKADRLVLDGDLIHGYAGYPDNSIEILDDLIDNPDPAVIALLGNHELMQIYHMGQVAKNGSPPFVPPFEERLEAESRDREKYIAFMKAMPYAIRTAGGVTINHTGAHPHMAGYGRPGYGLFNDKDPFELMDGLDHDIVLKVMKDVTRTEMEEKHGKLADDYFDDYTPEIGQVFARHPFGGYLIDAIFHKGERHFPEETYTDMLNCFLEVMGRGGRPQRVLVAAHMEVPEGYQVFGAKQLRICSSYGAPDDKKVLAVVDAKKPYAAAGELVNGLVPLNK